MKKLHFMFETFYEVHLLHYIARSSCWAEQLIE